MENHLTDSHEVIDEGRTVEEAIEKGLARLGATRDEVEVEVLEEGSKGVLGLVGARQARVIVRKKDDQEVVRAKIEEMVTNLMKLMEISAQVSVDVRDDLHLVKIDTAGVDGLLIGKKGQNLEALEHLTRRMVGKQLKRSVRLQVDIGGYRERRTNALRNKALSMAAKVKATNKEMQVEPLSAAERRIIHLALANDPQVKTYTIGEGDLKSVVIAPQRRSRPTTEASSQGDE